MVCRGFQICTWRKEILTVVRCADNEMAAFISVNEVRCNFVRTTMQTDSNQIDSDQGETCDTRWDHYFRQPLRKIVLRK